MPQAVDALITRAPTLLERKNQENKEPRQVVSGPNAIDVFLERADCDEDGCQQL